MGIKSVAIYSDADAQAVSISFQDHHDLKYHFLLFISNLPLIVWEHMTYIK